MAAATSFVGGPSLVREVARGVESIGGGPVPVLLIDHAPLADVDVSEMWVWF